MKERRLLFACQRSIAASKGAGRQGVGSLSAWLPVLVPCVGMIPISCILHVVAQGGIVGLMTCRADCPFHQSEAVQGKIGYCQQVLHLLGGSPEQVTLVSVTDRLGSELWPGSPSDAAIPTVIQGDSHPPLFGPEAMAVALFKLKEALGAPGRLSLDHPYSPLGVVAVRAQQCTGCGVCALACPTQALQLRRDHMEVALTFEPGQCIACGLCAVRCPETKAGAIRTYRVTDFASLAQGRTTLYLDSEPRCEACGATIAPRSMLKRLADLLGPDSVDLSSVIGRYCPLCRVQRGADG